MGPTRKPLWFQHLTGTFEDKSRGPSSYPSEGTPTGDTCSCGEPLRWVYGYKRRRPRVRCLVCDPLLTAEGLESSAMDVAVNQDPSTHGGSDDGLVFRFEFRCPPGILPQDLAGTDFIVVESSGTDLEGALLRREAEITDGENIVTSLEAEYASIATWLARFGHTAHMTHDET